MLLGLFTMEIPIIYVFICIMVVLMLFILPWIEWKMCFRRTPLIYPAFVEVIKTPRIQMSPIPSYSEFAPPDYDTAIKMSSEKPAIFCDSKNQRIFVIEIPENC